MLAFIHIHKTGGTTIQWILRSSFGPRHCEAEPLNVRPLHLMPWQVPVSANDLQHLSRLYPHLESIGGHCVQPHMDLEKNDPEINYFTFMRDPLKMRASMYQHGVQALGEQNCVFEDWLREEQSQNRQTKMIAGKADVDKAIRVIQDRNVFVGLTDRFDESLLLLKSLVANNLNISYKRMNMASGSTITQSLLSSARTRQMLIEGNEADLKLYDFVKHELYPAYQREYGKSLAEDVSQYKASLSRFSRRSVTLSFMGKPRLFKLLLFWDLEPYNRRNVPLSLLKKYLLYKPWLYLDRKGIRI